MFGLEFTGGVATARFRSDKVYGSTHRYRVTKAVVCLTVHYLVDPIVIPCYIHPLFKIVALVCNSLTAPLNELS